MPQIFQVLRCYKCSVFQVHQTKKSNKFQCKLCGEKQSIKRHYGVGNAKECRIHVQKLNGIRQQKDELNSSSNSFSDQDSNNVDSGCSDDEKPLPVLPTKSKWSDYVDSNNDSLEENVKTINNDTMMIDGKEVEVVLEMPKKKFRKPSKKEDSSSSGNVLEDSFLKQSFNNENKVLSRDEIPKNNFYKPPPSKKSDSQYLKNIIVDNFHTEEWVRDSYSSDNVENDKNIFNKSRQLTEDKTAQNGSREILDFIDKLPRSNNNNNSRVSNQKFETNKSSRWAQFVEDEVEQVDSNEDSCTSQNDFPQQNSKSLFSLIENEDDIDALLEF